MPHAAFVISRKLEWSLAFHVLADIEFSNQALQNDAPLTATCLEIHLEALVVGTIKAILYAFGANGLGANQFFVLGAVLAKAFGDDRLGEEGPFSFLVLNFAIVPLGDFFQAGQLTFEQRDCFFAGRRSFYGRETYIFNGHYGHYAIPRLQRLSIAK
jgi:hypothetical protein